MCVCVCSYTLLNNYIIEDIAEAKTRDDTLCPIIDTFINVIAMSVSVGNTHCMSFICVKKLFIVRTRTLVYVSFFSTHQISTQIQQKDSFINVDMRKLHCSIYVL